jgi:hypothetical protein
MGEQFGLILLTPERLDPFCGANVLVRALRPRDLPVRDVPDDDVAEGVLRLPLDGRAAFAPHELLPRERPQVQIEQTSVGVADRRERTGPEHLPDDGGVLKQSLLVGRQRVEARRDDPLHGLGHVSCELAPLRVHPRELLGVERIPTGAVQQLRLGVGGKQRAVEQRGDEPRRVVGVERRQRDRQRVALAAAPVGTPVEQLRPRGAQDEQRNVRAPVGQRVDEVEQLVPRPVEVLEHHDQRPPLGQPLEERAPRGERLVPLARLTAEPEEWTKLALDPAAVRFADAFLHGADQLARDLLRRVVLDDPGLRLHHLAERPERDPLAVWKRAAVPPEDEVRQRLDMGEQLGDEPALPDTGDADERDELRGPLLANTLERVDELVELALPAHEGNACRDCLAADTRARLERLPHAHRLRLALRLDCVGFAEIDCVLRRAVGRLTDEHPVHGSRALQPRGRVHHVSGRHPLARFRASREVDQRLARVDGDANLDLAALASPVANRKGGADSALRVVLVRDRCAEQRHHRIADELLDGSAEPFELRAQPLVIRAQDRLDVLGIELLGTRCEADEVGEQHGDDLPLAAGIRHPPSLGRPPPSEQAPARRRTARLRHLYEQTGVHQRANGLRLAAVAQVEDRVLRVPPVDALVLPDERTEPVLRAKAVTREQAGPPGRPLPVPSRPAALVRDGRAEEHRRREPRDRLDQRRRTLLRNVVRRLERDREIELAVEPERLGEVARDELVRVDPQCLALDVRAVDAEDGFDAVLAEHLQPGAGAAPDVDHARRPQPLENERDDDVRRTLRGIALPAEVRGVEVRGCVAEIAHASGAPPSRSTSSCHGPSSVRRSRARPRACSISSRSSRSRVKRRSLHPDWRVPRS